MEKESKTKKELIEDLADLRQQLADLKKSRSETKNFQQELQASETRYRHLFETAQDGILILNAETGQIDDVNPYLIDMLHYSHEEFMGMKLWEVSPFKNTVLNRAAFEELQDKGCIRYKDLPLETKEGKPIAAEFVSNVYKVNGNKVIQCNIRNITENKEVKQKLQEAVLFQQRLIDALPVPVFYKDSEGRYLGCNSSFEKFFGQKREQVTGKSVYELSSKEFADIYHEKDLVLLQNPGIQIYESTVKDAGGVVHNVIFHRATFPNMDGSVGGLIGGILDITDSKRAQEALRDSEGRLRILVQTIPDLIWLKDKDGVYLSCNTMFERFFGAREADIVGKTDYDFVDRELADSFREHDKKAMAAGKTTSNEEWITFADGGHRVFLDTIKTPMYDSQGMLIGMLGIGRDITDRRAVERIRKALGATIHAIAVTVEARDPYTAGHQRRVADLARSIATEMNLPDDQIDGIRMAATIHDLGKISVPAEILSKPTKLTNIELMLIKIHSQSGYDILKDIDFPWPVARMILEHHERMNGSGYPNGLTGDNILLESRILAVADVLESMASHRPYRPSLGIDAAMKEIESNRGILYDINAVNACLRLFREKGFKLE
ncbi:MAG: PAS domain S-box protein [Thermodesulfobacteriota bacterium]|jgi:PAS domain S-box-containing protein